MSVFVIPLLSRHALSAALALGLTTAMSIPAMALDAEALMKRYTETALAQGQTFEYESISNETDTSFTVIKPSWLVPTLSPITAAKADFKNITESSGGSMTIGSVSLGEISAGSDKISVTFSDAIMENLKLPSAAETDPLGKFASYSRFVINNGKVVANGHTVATIGKGEITLSPYVTSAPITFAMTIDDTSVDVSNDPKMMQTISAMGYDGRFTGRLIMDGSWNAESGVIDLPRYDTIIDNVGTISIPMSLGGYTAEMMTALQDAGKDGDQAMQAASMQMMQQIELRSMAIKLKDDSVTERGLELASKMMGQDPKALAQGAPMMIGLGMQRLNMPEFTQQLSQAVGAFLLNPGTLSISATPEKPVPIMGLAIMSQTNPAELAKSLKLKAGAE